MSSNNDGLETQKTFPVRGCETPDDLKVREYLLAFIGVYSRLIVAQLTVTGLQ
ncbi:MAG TPA: hypothetical protein PLP19_16010 [bacterium]|nr:hypothetical protein [bacterium]HPN44997.1 hypothetical protein [bacterium]